MLESRAVIAPPCPVFRPRRALLAFAALVFVACSPGDETPSNEGLCEVSADCPAGQACRSGRCVVVPCGGLCTAHEVCLNQVCTRAEGLSCARDRGLCPVGYLCTANSVCQRICDTFADCKDPDFPSCSPVAGYCGECTFHSDCGPGLPRCNENTARCVGCLNDRDCLAAGKAAGQVCDPATLTCVDGCRLRKDTEPSDCAQGERCDGATVESLGRCIECKPATEAFDCVSRPGKPRCHTTSARCVECVEDPDCGGNKQCDQNRNICVECTTNEGCLPGNVCNQQSYTCQPGCVGGLGGPNCPADTVCDPSQGAAGVCVACLEDSHCPRANVCVDKQCVPGCKSDARCADPTGGAVRTRCDPGAQPYGACVECLSNLHCGEGKVCDSVKKMCRCKKLGETCAASEQCGFRDFGPDDTVDCSAARPLCVDRLDCWDGVRRISTPVCSIAATGNPGEQGNCPSGYESHKALAVGATGTSTRQCVSVAIPATNRCE